MSVNITKESLTKCNKRLHNFKSIFANRFSPVDSSTFQYIYICQVVGPYSSSSESASESSAIIALTSLSRCHWRVQILVSFKNTKTCLIPIFVSNRKDIVKTLKLLYYSLIFRCKECRC